MATIIPVGDDDIVLKYFDDSGPFQYAQPAMFMRNDMILMVISLGQATIISNAGGISAWTNIFPFINDGEDGFYIAWHDDRDNNLLSSIFVQHIDSDGNVQLADDGVEASIILTEIIFMPILHFHQARMIFLFSGMKWMPTRTIGEFMDKRFR